MLWKKGERETAEDFSQQIPQTREAVRASCSDKDHVPRCRTRTTDFLLCACCAPVRAGMSRKRRRPRGGRGASKRARTEAVGLAPQDAYIVGCVLEELVLSLLAA